MPDTVQIGSFIISKVIIDVFAPLLGTLIGGLITYFSTRAVENRKWEQQKRDRLQEQRREASAIALEWLDPIRNALTKASLISSASLYERRSAEELRKSWPDLLTALSRMDPPTKLQVLLPASTYERGLQIIHGLDELRTFTIFNTPSKPEDWQVRLEQCTKHIATLQNILSSLEKDLLEEYQQTFQ